MGCCQQQRYQRQIFVLLVFFLITLIPHSSYICILLSNCMFICILYMLGFGLNPLVVFSISVISRVRPDVFHLCMMGITKRLLKYLNILCYTASPTNNTNLHMVGITIKSISYKYDSLLTHLPIQVNNSCFQHRRGWGRHQLVLI